MDASKFQLISLSIQDGNSIAFYNRKLTGPQQRYTVTENELFSIVENLKEIFTLLLD